jgi:RNA polymerase sigma-70 factor (ECF subfamily)
VRTGGKRESMLRRTDPTGDPVREGLLTADDLAAARQREPEAVARIYKAYSNSLFRFFMAGIGDRQTAEDLTGTVFADAIEALPNFRGPVEALGGWLFRIARHDLLDYRRSQARHRTDRLDDRLEEVAEAEVAVDPQDLALSRLESSRVVGALRDLSDDQREVLLLRMVSGLSTAEVATAVGKTVGAVKALQHRGLASLSRLLAADQAKSSRTDPYPSGTPRRLAEEETQ